MHNITKLVFEGGGVKGIAYAGALQVFEQKGALQKIDGVAGTSAGAITACLLSLRYSTADIKTLVGQVNFGSFADDENILKKYHYYGMHPGDTFLEWLKQCIKNTFETLLEAQSFIYQRDPEQVARTVVIDDLGVSSTDFDITDAQKQALFDAGVAAVTRYFDSAG